MCFFIYSCTEVGLFNNNNSLSSSQGISRAQPICGERAETREETPETRLQVLMNTWDGCVLLSGWADSKECGYNASSLSDEDRALFTARGLSIIEANADIKCYEQLNPIILSSYYRDKEDYKKAMYWAFRGAEKGSSSCMLILANTYKSGNGLVQDVSEAIKWTYLGAAAGDAGCKQWIENNGISGLSNQYVAPFLIEGQKRANQWMKEHPDVFISAD
jgi:hypothetical protein